MNALEKLCKPIKMILSDVDGVLTDGGIIYLSSGEEIKRFDSRDGFGIKIWQKMGGRFGLISGRSSQIVRRRADELGIMIVRQGVRDKKEVVESIMESSGLCAEEICFIGDDFPDLPAMHRVGMAATVADAPDDIRKQANWVSCYNGGHGAVRELIETVMKQQQCWMTAVQNYQH